MRGGRDLPAAGPWINALVRALCGRWDSNPQAFRHWDLNPARLPVSPRPRGSFTAGYRAPTGHSALAVPFGGGACSIERPATGEVVRCSLPECSHPRRSPPRSRRCWSYPRPGPVCWNGAVSIGDSRAQPAHSWHLNVPMLHCPVDPPDCPEPPPELEAGGGGGGGGATAGPRYQSPSPPTAYGCWGP